MKIVLKYFECIEENDLLIQLLKNFGCKTGEMVEILLLSKDEVRIFKIIKENVKLTKHLETVDIVKHRMFSLLGIFDPLDLIDKFNLKLNVNASNSPILI